MKLDGLTIGKRCGVAARNTNIDAFQEKPVEVTLAFQRKARGWFRKKQDRAAGAVVSPKQGLKVCRATRPNASMHEH